VNAEKYAHPCNQCEPERQKKLIFDALSKIGIRESQATVVGDVQQTINKTLVRVVCREGGHETRQMLSSFIDQPRKRLGGDGLWHCRVCR